MSSYTEKQIGWAIVTFAVYSFLFSWQVALLIMITVGFHECSHLFAARKLGMATKGFFFIPFVGGMALIAGPYKKLSDKAIVLLAGPIGGGLLAGVTAVGYYITHNIFLGYAAYLMTVMNLFNLIPISFMDGGQLLGSITTSINRTLGLVCLVVTTVIGIVGLLLISPILGLFLVLTSSNLIWNEYHDWKNFREGNLELVSKRYLNPPVKLSSAEMSFTIGAWSLTAGLLILLLSVLPAPSLVNSLIK